MVVRSWQSRDSSSFSPPPMESCLLSGSLQVGSQAFLHQLPAPFTVTSILVQQDKEEQRCSGPPRPGTLPSEVRSLRALHLPEFQADQGPGQGALGPEGLLDFSSCSPRAGEPRQFCCQGCNGRAAEASVPPLPPPENSDIFGICDSRTEIPWHLYLPLFRLWALYYLGDYIYLGSLMSCIIPRQTF